MIAAPAGNDETQADTLLANLRRLEELLQRPHPALADLDHAMLDVTVAKPPATDPVAVCRYKLAIEERHLYNYRHRSGFLPPDARAAIVAEAERQRQRAHGALRAALNRLRAESASVWRSSVLRGTPAPSFARGLNRRARRAAVKKTVATKSKPSDPPAPEPSRGAPSGRIGLLTRDSNSRGAE